MKKNKYLIALLFCFAFLMFGTEAFAQCPMCKIAAESNMKNGGTMGAGLNDGILYMLAAPYLFVGILVYLWIKNKKNVLEDDKLNADPSFFGEN
jgi:hypothetical protein